MVDHYRDARVEYPVHYDRGPHEGEIRYLLGPPLDSVYELVRYELAGIYLIDGDSIVLSDGSNLPPLVLSETAAKDQWGEREMWGERLLGQEMWEVGEWVDDELVDEFLREVQDLNDLTKDD